MHPVEGIGRLHSIHVVPVGSLAHTEGERLTALLSLHVAVPCSFNAASLDNELRLLPGREQADADYLLRRLEEHSVARGTAVVGVTETDLGLPILTHVFGGAREGGHTAVVSLARLRQEFYGLPASPQTTKRRAVAEILHEVGHLLGLRHCSAYDCLMHFSPDVESIDLRGLSFCEPCTAELPAGFLATASARYGR